MVDHLAFFFSDYAQHLHLIAGFDESSIHSAVATSQKVRLMISKLIEDRLGETLDLVIYFMT